MRFLAQLLLIITAFTAHAEKSLQVDASQPGFMVTLAANPTTGYQWVVKQYDEKRFALKSSRYIAEKTGRIGSGGNTQFYFLLKAGQTYPKKTRMSFAYMRPWEANQGKIRNITVRFSRVRAKLSTDPKKGR